MTTNEQLAVKLFGWRQCTNYVEDGWEKSANGEHTFVLPQWDSTWQGAGEVIEAMIEKGWLLTFTIAGNEGAYATFHKPQHLGNGISDTAPEAIAKAALEALKNSE